MLGGRRRGADDKSYSGAVGGGTSCLTPRRLALLAAAVALLLVWSIGAEVHRQHLANRSVYEQGEPLLLVGIISCRARSCARARRMMRTESWPSLLDQRALVNGTRTADSNAVFADTGHGWTDWRRSVKYVFVLGHEMKGVVSSTAAELAAEQEQYHDMVFFDVDDDHASFTQKTRELVKWFDDTDPCYTRVPEGTNLTCPEGKAGVPLLPRHSFYMKADDDVFVHVPNLAHWLRWNRDELSLIPTQFRGRLMSNTLWNGVVIRDPKKRFSDPSFPRDLYPPYPNGPAYVFNREGLSAIAAVARSPFAPTYVNEDATVGVWMDVLGTGTIQHIDEWRFWTQPGRCFDDMLAYHIGTPQAEHANMTIRHIQQYKDWETATTHRQFRDMIRAGCAVCSFDWCKHPPPLPEASDVVPLEKPATIRFSAPGYRPQHLKRLPNYKPPK